MTVSISQYQVINGVSDDELTLTNHRGMQVKLLSFGATLEKVLLPGKGGKLTDVILSLDSPADYSKERNFLGGTVGRVVGRLRGCVWHRGDGDVQLPMTEGKNHIHGGEDGLDRQRYDFSLQSTAQSDAVTFTYLDPANHNGFPGNLKLQVTYTLDDDNRLSYQIKAQSDATTLFNPTNHTYFALAGTNSDVTGTTLQLAADYYEPLDSEQLPKDGWHAVKGTPFDLTKGQNLGQVLASSAPQIKDFGGLNHPFLLHGNPKDPAAVVTAGRRKMVMRTDAPAIVVYTANHFANTPGLTSHIAHFGGVALEAQFPPVSGQNWSAITLLAGEVFSRHTSWQFFDEN